MSPARSSSPRTNSPLRHLKRVNSLRTDIINAGGKWVDQECCIDKGLVTSRNPNDLDAFCKNLVETFAAYAQKASA